MRVNRFVLHLLLLTGLSGSVLADDLVVQVVTQNYPHVQALLDGRVKAKGCQLIYSTSSLAAIEANSQEEKRADVMEVDFLPFLEKQSAGSWADYTLIPVFLSRGFQLRNIFIRTDRGIRGPLDLRGKTVGVAGYGSTNPTLIRGILQSSWTIKPEEITWFDTEASTGPRRSLSDLLTSGKVDAIFSTVEPAGLSAAAPKVARLFPHYREIEYDVFKQNRVFAILTALAIRKQLVQDNPWLPESLFRAFSEAKTISMKNHTLPSPWGDARLEETEQLMGKNFWSYGVTSNPKTLGAEFRFINEQGLLKRPLKIDDVFEPSTLLLLEN